MQIKWHWYVVLALNKEKALKETITSRMQLKYHYRLKLLINSFHFSILLYFVALVSMTQSYKEKNSWGCWLNFWPFASLHWGLNCYLNVSITATIQKRKKKGAQDKSGKKKKRKLTQFNNPIWPIAVTFYFGFFVWESVISLHWSMDLIL